jgi:hypothetical protein
MTLENYSPEKREQEFLKGIIADYLKYGSVDEIFKIHEYSLPISYPGVHRLLDKWGIVKAAGPNSKLSEALVFLHLLSEEKITLEKFYKNIPPSFRTSLSTMYRILHNIKEGIIRRSGTALVISPTDKKDLVLVGDDISTPRLNLGKPYGSISLPMTYSKKEEKSSISILRVLQQEVFTKEAVDNCIPDILPDNPEPFMYLDIADVRVAVYSIELATDYNFSSFKLINHRFMHISEFTGDISHGHFRSGLKEIALGYKKYLLGEKHSEFPIFEKSYLNLALASEC